MQGVRLHVQGLIKSFILKPEFILQVVYKAKDLTKLMNMKELYEGDWSISKILRPGTQLLHAPPSRCTDIPCKGSGNFMNDFCWELYYGS